MLLIGKINSYITIFYMFRLRIKSAVASAPKGRIPLSYDYVIEAEWAPPGPGESAAALEEAGGEGK